MSDSNHDYCNGVLTISDVCGDGSTHGDGAAKGVMAVDLRSFSDRERSMVGLDTASNAQPMTLELNFSAAISAQDVTVFAISEATFMLQDGRYNVSV